MKALFVQNIAGIAGSEKYFFALLPELKKRGICCQFLSIYKSADMQIAAEFKKILLGLSIEVFELEVGSYYSIKPVFEINKLQKRNKYDLIHTHLIYADFWAACSKKFLNSDIKIISTLHGYQEDLYVKYCLRPEQLPRTLYYFLAKFSLSVIDKVYACSYGLKSFYEKSGICLNKIDVIQHGFNYPNMEFAPRKNNRNVRLLIIGRLIERKGHMFVLNQFEKFLRENSDVELVILGGGEKEIELKNYVKSKGLMPFVRFEGFRSDIRQYIYHSDIVIVPSYAEGLPLVIFEAFAEKKPVVAFNTIGCNEAITDGVSGILVEPFNEELLMKKIIELVADKDRQKMLGENGYKQLKQHFSLQRMVDQTIAFYQKIQT